MFQIKSQYLDQVIFIPFLGISMYGRLIKQDIVNIIAKRYPFYVDFIDEFDITDSISQPADETPIELPVCSTELYFAEQEIIDQKDELSSTMLFDDSLTKKRKK
jgi:hypothetical protein